MPREEVLGLLKALWCEPALEDDGMLAVKNACLAGASVAAAAITAAAYYDNPLFGRESLVRCMTQLARLPLDEAAWTARNTQHWVDSSHTELHIPGFGYAHHEQSMLLTTHCHTWAERYGERSLPRCTFFSRQAQYINQRLGGINLAGLSAVVFLDCGVSTNEGERLFLLWHVARGLECGQLAQRQGFSAVAAWHDGFDYRGPRPQPSHFDEARIRKAVGLD